MMSNYLHMRSLFLSAFLVFLSACSDNATVTYYNKGEKLSCLRAVIFPPDKMISTTIEGFYSFKEDCPYRLEVGKKSGIVCNSNQNADKKALSNFPSGFIRMDVYKDNKPIYSYYKDLDRDVTKEDVKRAFKRLKSDILEK